VWASQVPAQSYQALLPFFGAIDSPVLVTPLLDVPELSFGLPRVFGLIRLKN